MRAAIGVACAGLGALSGVGLAVYIRRCKMRRVDTQMAEHLAALSERGSVTWHFDTPSPGLRSVRAEVAEVRPSGRHVNVDVPVGAEPGQSLLVTPGPGLKPLPVRIPRGVEPGGSFQVELPSVQGGAPMDKSYLAGNAP